MALLSLRNVSLKFGGHPLLDDVEIHIERGDRVCLLGVNGTGKSSFLRVVAGELQPDEGDVARQPGTRVTLLPQQVPADMEGRVMDIVCPESDDHEAHLSARQILGRLQLDPAADFATLSGGTRRRVMLARTLLGDPDIVLLDEPTNHLDLDSINWLESYLLKYCRTFLFVSHDRAFLRRLASRVIELDRGRINDWNCDYDTFLRRKEESLHAESRQWAEMDKKLQKEEVWLRQGVKARTTRNQGRVRALLELREQRAQRRESSGPVQLSIQESERTGSVVLKARHVTFGYGPQPLIHDFSTTITRGEKVGILGPNGCGKTTLLQLLLGGVSSDPDRPRLPPQSGTVSHGTNLKVAYSDQLRAQLNEDQSLADNIAPGREFVMIDGVRRHIFGYLQDFLFPPDRARMPVKALSGGERNRLLLAQIFAEPSNVLVMDEPTNDLDLDTLNLLEEQVAAYTGTVLLVSHDRTFLDNVVTSLLVFEKHPPLDATRWLGPGEGWYVNEYAGGHEDWARVRILPPAPAAASDRKPPAAKGEPAKARRLTFKEKKELDGLPERIETMESELARLHESMADPAFYRKPKDQIARITKRLDELAAEHETAYRRWEELEAIQRG